MDEYLVTVGTFEIELICLIKTDSEEEAKRIACEKNGKIYNDELRKHTEITAIKVDFKDGYFQYNPSEN